MFIMNISI